VCIIDLSLGNAWTIVTCQMKANFILALLTCVIHHQPQPVW